MLDQNTDRTWWMIGAVVVGAAVVGIALTMFPDLLTSAKTELEGWIDGVTPPTRP